MKAKGIIALAFYIGVGAILHLLFVGAQLDWSSAWTWGWLFAWPLPIAIMVTSVGLAACALRFVVIFTCGFYEGVMEGLRERRKGKSE